MEIIDIVYSLQIRNQGYKINKKVNNFHSHSKNYWNYIITSFIFPPSSILLFLPFG